MNWVEDAHSSVWFPPAIDHFTIGVCPRMWIVPRRLREWHPGPRHTSFLPMVHATCRFHEPKEMRQLWHTQQQQIYISWSTVVDALPHIRETKTFSNSKTWAEPVAQSWNTSQILMLHGATNSCSYFGISPIKSLSVEERGHWSWSP